MRRILLLKLTICLFSICFLLGNETAWGQKRDGYLKTDIRDLVLIYQGGVQRMDWNIEHIRPYVVHENRFGKRDWLFDGFLFLEFDSGKGVSFEARNNAPLAKKEDWLWLVDRHFEKGKGIDALNTCINEEISKLGKPSFKHQLVISLLQPVEGQKDWGEIDGKKLEDIKYILRKTESADIYFIANQAESGLVTLINAEFASACPSPEIWDAETGKIVPASVWDSSGGRTVAQLALLPRQSLFVVFDKNAEAYPHLKKAKWEPAKKLSDEREHMPLHNVTASPLDQYEKSQML